MSSIYALLPATHQPFRLLSPGGVAAVITWVVASALFGFYVQRFANYNATYGSLGAVVLLLLFFYLSAAILLFGAELNAALVQPSVDKNDDEQQAPPLDERAVGQHERPPHQPKA